MKIYRIDLKVKPFSRIWLYADDSENALTFAQKYFRISGLPYAKTKMDIVSILHAKIGDAIVRIDGVGCEWGFVGYVDI